MKNYKLVTCLSVVGLVGIHSHPVLASEDWTGVYGGLMATNTRNTVSGYTVKSDGTYGANASSESANVQSETGAWTGLLGKRIRLQSGVIAGLEADFSWLGLQSRSADYISSGGTYQGQPSATYQYETSWLVTGRLLAGWSFNDVLIYGTGGVAYASEKVERTQYKSVAGTSSTQAMFSETSQVTRLGSALGAGAEWRLNKQWSLRADYMNVRFPDATFGFPDARGGAQNAYTNVQGRLANNNAQINTLRMGVTYLFDGLK